MAGRRRVALIVLGVAAVVAGALGPGAPAAMGHSQLVASVPAAGDVVSSPPAAARLTFSEPIDGQHTSIDLLSGDGTTIARAIGSVDPSDPYTLVAPLPSLAAGTYTVDWRSLSAADGHSTSGTFTFGVGDVTPPPISADQAAAGALHAGHDEATTFLETESRIASDLGLMLATGLPIVAWLVLGRPRSSGIARASAAALLLSAIGAAGMLLLGGPASGIDVPAFIATHTGTLVTIRLAGAIAIGGLASVLARRFPGTALTAAGTTSAVGLILVALGGHAAAFPGPASLVAMVVHLFAASVWLGGLLALAWLAILPEHAPAAFGTIVPRFSGVALVSIGLVAATGAYADWLQTAALVSVATPYQATLLVKIALTVFALGVGFWNYRSAGLDERFRWRVAAEATLGVAIVVATGVLASGSPPGQAAPIEIARVASSALDPGDASLEISPGRPGPARFTVVLGHAPASDATVELDLSRLDQSGETRLTLRPAPDRLTWVAPGGLLPANSSFDATAIVRNGAGVEQSRTRFAFALDASTIVSGRATPPVDPVAVIVAALVVAAAAGFVLVATGRSLPATDGRTGRVALLGGSVVSVALAVIVLVGGPPA